MFSSMAQNLGHFLRIFRVLHTVQFSRSFAADSSGRSGLSGNSDTLSYLRPFVNNFLFLSSLRFPGRSSAPSLEASSIISKGFVNVNHFFHSFPSFSPDFSWIFQVLPRQQNRVEARPSSHYIFHSFPFSSLLIFGRPLYRSHHYRGCYAAVAAAVTAAAIFLS